jgi:transcriptional regulator with XRE-family HTH domain
MTEKTFGQQLREVRTRLGLSQMQLAKRLNVDPSSVAYMELRDTRPQFKTVQRYADALGVDVSVFGIELPAQEMTFGKRVRAYRLQRNWSQWDLAKKLGVGQGSINNLEVQNHEPQMKTVRKLAAVFGMTMDELCNGEIDTHFVPSGKTTQCRYCGCDSVIAGNPCPQCNAIGGK